MEAGASQRLLDGGRIAAFYHDLFVDTQVRHFQELCAGRLGDKRGVVADVGGGCGFFAAALVETLGVPTRVIDTDPVSVERARQAGVDAIEGDATKINPNGDESVVCFNLILHHLVSDSEARTSTLQLQALSRWKEANALVFVNEYIYDSYAMDASGALIFHVTSSSLLSRIASIVSRFIPSLRANTFGVGVRFRSATEWVKLFESNGWRVVATRKGEEEPVSLARRLLLIRSCRRDSFLLQATGRLQ